VAQDLRDGGPRPVPLRRIEDLLRRPFLDTRQNARNATRLEAWRMKPIS
jgi:hypothetical protein